MYRVDAMMSTCCLVLRKSFECMASETETDNEGDSDGTFAHDPDDATFLVIDHHAPTRKIIQRIEHIVVDYLRDPYDGAAAFSFPFMLTKYRIRINKRALSRSYQSAARARSHACMWRVLSFIYERLQSNQTHTMTNRELYYSLLEQAKLFGTQQEVDKMVFSSVSISFRTSIESSDSNSNRITLDTLSHLRVAEGVPPAIRPSSSRARHNLRRLRHQRRREADLRGLSRPL